MSNSFITKIETKVEKPVSAFIDFINNQAMIGPLLLLASSLGATMVTFQESSKIYFYLQNATILVGFEDKIFNFTIIKFVNDFLMTFFFFLLGIEIKRELLAGELSEGSIRKTVFLAAIGGVLFPLVIFLFCVNTAEYHKGWGIPLATDTAFVIGILSLFRKKLPPGLFAYVAALSVTDDLIAILVIALFYTTNIYLDYLFWAACSYMILIILNILGTRNISIYLICGCVVWALVEKAGLHGTLAGVLVSLAIPARAKKQPQSFVKKVSNLTSKLEKKLEDNSENILKDPAKEKIVHKIENLAQEASLPMTRAQNKLEPIVILIILPIFAFLNSDIPISSEIFKNTLHNQLSQAIFFSLLFGKTFGIFSLTFISCRFLNGKLPDNTTLLHIVGISFLASIGFTMSIFISELAFLNETLVKLSKAGIFTASLVATIIGILFFMIITKGKTS